MKKKLQKVHQLLQKNFSESETAEIVQTQASIHLD